MKLDEIYARQGRQATHIYISRSAWPINQKIEVDRQGIGKRISEIPRIWGTGQMFSLTVEDVCADDWFEIKKCPTCGRE